MAELVAKKALAEGRVTEIDIELVSLAAERRDEATSTLQDLHIAKSSYARSARR